MDKILVLDFGGQYNQLIARRVRNQDVYAEIRACDKISLKEIVEKEYKGIIFTGGPNSVYDEKSPHYDKEILNAGIPILGICYGHQLMAYMAGGEIKSAKNNSEYGKTTVFMKPNKLFKDIPNDSICWMSHTDYVNRVPEGFIIIADTAKCPCVAMANDEKRLYSVQFHPEVTHTEYGTQILRNFIFDICGCKAEWKMEDYSVTAVRELKERLGDKKVLLAISGGVDSSVAAVLLNKAIGKNLYCVFVDHGLLRKNEGDYVENLFKGKFGINLTRVNAQERFLKKLEGVTEPERKRKIIGEEFIRVFEEEAKKFKDVEVLAQGTIYPDVIESGAGSAAVIKSHHNVGGLPENMLFNEIVEPLRMLFKDEVRKLGLELGLPKEMVFRQPFPGPGLAVRVIGDITEEKLSILRDADAIFREVLENSNIDNLPNQYFAVILNTKSVGVKGDFRAYGYTIALRAVTTDDFMTAEWTRIPFEILEKASSRIANEIKDVTRVVYDITSKPPATVEWE